MKRKSSMKHNTHYATSPLSFLAVPRGFNLDRCRFRVCVDVHSDVTRGKVFFFQYHGMYWFSLHVMPTMRCAIQSHPFLSMSNCISALLDNMRLLRFTIENRDVLRDLSRIDSIERRNVAADTRRPTTWRV